PGTRLACQVKPLDPLTVFRVYMPDGKRRSRAHASQGDGQPAWTLTGVKLTSLVAPENASAVPSLASNFGALLPPSPDRGALLAPVLVR
ncbi:MAG: hypothetical protein AAF368_05065, partial [Planctomycetota bacterium]